LHTLEGRHGAGGCSVTHEWGISRSRFSPGGARAAQEHADL